MDESTEILPQAFHEHLLNSHLQSDAAYIGIVEIIISPFTHCFRDDIYVYLSYISEKWG